MKYRPQRGGLIDSMNECVSIPATVEALCAVINKQLEYMCTIRPEDVTLTAYYAPDIENETRATRRAYSTHVIHAVCPVSTSSVMCVRNTSRIGTRIGISGSSHRTRATRASLAIHVPYVI